MLNLTDTALVVGILSSLTTGVGFLVGHRLTLKRDREARAAEQREARALRQNQFQRETLLALQTASESLLDAALATGRSWNEYRRALKEAEPREGLESESEDPSPLEALKVDRVFWRAYAVFNTLHVRVRDKDVKQACIYLSIVCATMSAPYLGPDKWRDRRGKVMVEFSALQDYVGKVLAALDALDESA